MGENSALLRCSGVGVSGRFRLMYLGLGRQVFTMQHEHKKHTSMSFVVGVM